MNIFIIPGNPPALHFYEAWKKEILQWNSAASVYVSTYPDLPFRQNSHEYLKKVSQHHCGAFLAYQRELQKPLILLGHSLGAFFSFDILKEHKDLVEKCFFIHPFLRSPALQGKSILRFMNFARKWSVFEEIILKAKGLLENFDADIKHVTPSELLTCLRLSYHEYEVIVKNKEAVVVAPELRKKLQLIYTPGDKWCTAMTVQQFKQQIEASEVGSSHDFIRFPEERKRVYRFLEATLSAGSG